MRLRHRGLRLIDRDLMLSQWCMVLIHGKGNTRFDSKKKKGEEEHKFARESERKFGEEEMRKLKERILLIPH